jgi:HNH endonuclease
MAKEDHLTADRLRELLHYDPATGIFTWRIANGGLSSPGKVAGCATARYPCVQIDGKQYSLHRIAWLHSYGEWPQHHIDHINRDKRDNRLCNLRDVTQSVNQQNRRTHARSGHQNVYIKYRPKRSGGYYTYYEVAINVRGKTVFCNSFCSLDKAIEVAEKARQKYYPIHVNSRS